MRWQAVLAAPFGALGLRTGGGALTEIVFLTGRHTPVAPADAIAAAACREIDRYLADPRHRIRVPLALRGTPFQRRVWDAIARIPAGETRRYGEIAAELGSAPRAVGQACGENPFPLVVPCHRVVSASGVGGFAHRSGGALLGVKRWLLAHESTGRDLAG